jgi:hypothetical protein
VTRRLALLLPVCLWADERSDILDLVAPLATALSNGDPEEFLKHIPEDCPNRAQLADNVRGLMAQAEVTCSVDIKNIQNGRAELDWLMDIRARATETTLERRKGAVVVTVRDRALASIEPASFFRPATMR